MSEQFAAVDCAFVECPRINYKLSKLFVVGSKIKSQSNETYVFPTQHGSYFIAIESAEEVEHVYTLRRLRVLDAECSEYDLIHTGTFWNGSFSFDERAIQSDDRGIRWVEFETKLAKEGECNSYDVFNASIEYVCHRHGGDQEGVNNVFGFGKCSATYFCPHCRGTDKHGFGCELDVKYRTRQSVAVQRERYAAASSNKEFELSAFSMGSLRSVRVYPSYGINVGVYEHVTAIRDL